MLLLFVIGVVLQIANVVVVVSVSAAAVAGRGAGRRGSSSCIIGGSAAIRITRAVRITRIVVETVVARLDDDAILQSEYDD
jgi:hypothetical protein